MAYWTSSREYHHTINADGRCCPMCNSRYSLYVRDLASAMRPGLGIPLFYCMECSSFASPSGWIETDEENLESLDWHKSVYTLNKERYDVLLPALAPKRGILDIGCGIGTLLVAGRDYGLPGVGFDLNSHAAKYGRSTLGVDVRVEEWTADTPLDFEPDIIACISVMEHLERPRDLFLEFAKAARRYSAKIYIHLPLLNETCWPFIFEPHRDPVNFSIPDQHICHPTWKGVQSWAQLAPGMKVDYFETHGLAGCLFSFE